MSVSLWSVTLKNGAGVTCARKIVPCAKGIFTSSVTIHLHHHSIMSHTLLYAHSLRLSLHHFHSFTCITSNVFLRFPLSTLLCLFGATLRSTSLVDGREPIMNVEDYHRFARQPQVVASSSTSPRKSRVVIRLAARRYRAFILSLRPYTGRSRHCRAFYDGMTSASIVHSQYRNKDPPLHLSYFFHI